MNDIKVKKKGRKPTYLKIFNKLLELKKGESFILLKEDWELKTLPGAYILRRRTGKEFEVRTLTTEKGWKITAI